MFDEYQSLINISPGPRVVMRCIYFARWYLTQHTPHKQSIFFMCLLFKFSIRDTFVFVEQSHHAFIFFIDDILFSMLHNNMCILICDRNFCMSITRAWLLLSFRTTRSHCETSSRSLVNFTAGITSSLCLILSNNIGMPLFCC
jgi:hypothetical protein